MKTRKLLDGKEVPELEKSVKLEIKTKCPRKWLLTDLQTGEKYLGHEDPKKGPSHWEKINA